MRTWKQILLTVLINLGILAAIIAFAWARGALALPLGQPSSPAAPEASIQAAVPTTMNYQGLLLDDQGNPISGTHDLHFTIYVWSQFPPPWHWSEVFSETHTVDLDRGLFNVALGSINALDPAHFGGASFLLGGAMEIGVQVDGGAELSPRADLNTVPYAFRSDYSNHLSYPEYNSGWTDTPASGGYWFDHNVGYYASNYVVVLDCRDPSLGTYDCQSGSGVHAYWYNLDETQIAVYVPVGGTPDEIRVRIWVSR